MSNPIENNDPAKVPVTIELGQGILSFEEDDRARIDRLTVALEKFNAQADRLTSFAGQLDGLPAFGAGD